MCPSFQLHRKTMPKNKHKLSFYFLLRNFAKGELTKFFIRKQDWRFDCLALIYIGLNKQKKIITEPKNSQLVFLDLQSIKVSPYYILIPKSSNSQFQGQNNVINSRKQGKEVTFMRQQLQTNIKTEEKKLVSITSFY